MRPLPPRTSRCACRHSLAALQLAAPHLAALGLVLALAADGALSAAPPADGAERLWAAARTGDVATVRSLLAAGVAVDAPFRAGGTALLFASQHGHREVVEALLGAGADVAAREQVNGWGALLWAAFGGHCEVLPVLLSHGADPNQKELSQGLTPLAMAVVRGDGPCVDALLASPKLTPATLEHAASFATRMGKKDLVARLAARTSAAPVIPAWPQFRGPAASGVAEAAHPPTKWDAVAGSHLRWKTAIPGLGHSSPVVAGDRVFVTTAVKDGDPAPVRDTGNPMDSMSEAVKHSWRLLCLDAKSGAVLWERTAAEGLPGTRRHPKNSFASATPATDGSTVVALFGDQGLFAYSMTGELRWSRDLGPMDAGFFYDPGFQWGTASSPILWNGLVIVQVDVQKGSYVAAFSLADGKPVWRTERDELPTWGTPTIHARGDRAELVTNGVQKIRGYDPATGAELWSLTTGNSFVSASTPVASADLIVVGNGYRPLKPIYAIRPGGRGDLSPEEGESSGPHLAWSLKTGGPYYTTPLLYGDLLYVVSDDGVLGAYLSANGELVYRQRLGSGKRFSASPVAAEGRLYLAAEDGEVLVVKAGTEYQLLATNLVGEACLATPAIAGETVFVRGRHHLFAFGEGPMPAPPAQPTPSQ